MEENETHPINDQILIVSQGEKKQVQRIQVPTFNYPNRETHKTRKQGKQKHRDRTHKQTNTTK